MRLAMIGLVTCGALLAGSCRRSQPGCESAGTSRTAGPWQLAIRVPDSAHRGDSVHFALILKNVGDSAVDPHLSSPEAADFIVTRPGDTSEVWSKLHGAQLLSTALRKGAIAPGDSFRIEHRWDQRGNDRQLVPRGAYCVRGNLIKEGLDSLRTEVATLRVLR